MVGPGARHVETLPEKEVLDGCMELIRRFLGSTYAVVDCTAMKRYFCKVANLFCIITFSRAGQSGFQILIFAAATLLGACKLKSLKLEQISLPPQ